MTKTCGYCGQTFSKPQRLSNVQWENRTFCSNACRGNSVRKERRICACGCGERVVQTKSRYRLGHGKTGTGTYIYLSNPSTRKKPRWVVSGRDSKSTYYARAVMSAHLGRDLLPTEVVDYKNGDSTDDRIENLTLFASHSEHMKEEYKRKRQRKGVANWNRD